MCLSQGTCLKDKGGTQLCGGHFAKEDRRCQILQACCSLLPSAASLHIVMPVLIPGCEWEGLTSCAPLRQVSELVLPCGRVLCTVRTQPDRAVALTAFGRHAGSKRALCYAGVIGAHLSCCTHSKQGYKGQSMMLSSCSSQAAVPLQAWPA